MKRLKIIFLFLVFFTPLKIQAQGSVLFDEQAQKITSSFLKKREGIVLWQELKTGRVSIFGEPRWKDEKFLPGSLMKLITLQADLQKAIQWNYRCVGHDKIHGKRVGCWTYHGHGVMQLPRALSESCNLFFATLGQSMGAPSILKVLQQYSFSSLPIEVQPNEVWRFAIGDFVGFQVSPKEMLHFWEAFLPLLSQSDYQPVKQGLLRSTQEGTAKQGSISKEWILAKTGTGDSLKKTYPTNGWFLGAYPADSPKWIWCILIQNAHGFEEPAQLSKKLFILAKKVGVLEK